MSRKSLILYATWGGNTEKVAMRFKQVFERKGWECDTLKVTKDTDIKDPPFRLDDYDMLCVGSLVIGGLPTKEIFDDHLGLLMPASLFRGRPSHWNSTTTEFEAITEGYGTKKGIAFVTYEGGRRGPPEAIPALDMLEMRLDDMRVKCIGKFACPGGHARREPTGNVGILLEKKAMSIEDASAMLARYKENPDRPEFTDLPEEDQKLIAEAAAAPRTEQARPGPRRWHWDEENRPSERDLLKAEIFLEEILEDYYEGGVEAAPLAQYICIG